MRRLDEIEIPDPRPDDQFEQSFCGATVRFRGLKELLGAADYSKAGDRHAGLAAANEGQREAARTILADLTLEYLYDHPLTDAEGGVDSVMRVNYDIDRTAFQSLAHWTVGELKNHLLRCDGAEIRRVGRALTGVAAAAVAKLCDVHELILIARKVATPTQARTLLGAPGTLSSRTQPNHPTDDLRGISLLVLWGLSLGGGDALLGVNPAVDTVENVSAILCRLDALRRQVAAPTQICVLAHIKTQIDCLEQGAPVEVMFQSLAGTERTNLLEFGISVELLDRGWQLMADRGPLRDQARQFMYFETGQGSEFTYGKHNGIDMTTAEALCYGLARRYDPFMVNNVTGFIGPETHCDSFEMVLANLQDHFMGKLLGLPMGMAPCYTLHTQTILEGQQMATELLAAAGANYYMDVALNTDRMLAYFDTSAHDVQALREIYGKEPTAEFRDWGLARGIFARDAGGRLTRGPHWGDPQRLCGSAAEFAELTAATPALYGFATAGPRPADDVSRRLKLNQGFARAAIFAELDVAALQQIAPFVLLHTRAASHAAHLDSPDLGAQLAPDSVGQLAGIGGQVLILVSDGLSALAVNHNIPELLPVLLDGLAHRPWTVARPLLAQYGRVKLAEQLADLLQADVVVHLIGERPGGDALAARSLSAYLVHRLPATAAQPSPAARFEYRVISNIYSGGFLPQEAGAQIVEQVTELMNQHGAAVPGADL